MKLMNFNMLGLVADILLFLSGFLFLVDFAPRDILPKTASQKKAIMFLRENHNILLSTPKGVNINPSSSTMKIVSDPKQAELLINLVKKHSLLAHTVSWEKAVGIGYSTLSMPVGQYKLPAYYPLYIAILPSDTSTSLDLVPVGRLEDLDEWVSKWRQSSLTIFATISLTLGFLLQLIIRLFSPAT